MNEPFRRKLIRGDLLVGSIITLGIFGATVEAAEPYIQNGYTLIAVGIDTLLMGQAARNISDSLK